MPRASTHPDRLRPAQRGEGRSRRCRRRIATWAAAYLVLLLTSHAVIALRGAAPDPPFSPEDPRARLLDLPMMDDAGPVTASEEEPGDGGERDVGEQRQEPMRLAYLQWLPPTPPDPSRPPVVLLHGSPGRARNFDRLAPLLADRGYRVIAPDLPGFGDSSPDVPSYSTRAHAHAVRAMLDALGVRRAHLLGWSMGGGVAFHLVDDEPDRYASLTLLAAVGDQSVEGSGSHTFEKLKYGVGYALLVGGPHLIPHFGLLGTHEEGPPPRAFIRNFLDTDQREYTDIMRRLRTPTLILHGRDDFLVPDYAAELSHDLIQTSRLVMLDASHFLPFIQPDQTADHVAPFLARHDGPAAPPVRQRADLAPAAAMVDELIDELAPAVRAVPWWALLALVAVASAALPTGATLAAALLSSALVMDFGVAIAGLLVGMSARRAPTFGAPPPRPLLPRIASNAVLAPVMFTAASILSGAVVLPAGEHLGAAGLAVGFVASLALLRALPRVPTRRGRQHLRIAARRAMHHEFWPAWLFYLPAVPYWVYLALRHRHPLVFTCCNAAIQPGGGVIGESKEATLAALRAHPDSRPAILPSALIPPGPDPETRARAALDLIESDPSLGGLPVVLKPDDGYRGFGVRLARTEGDVRAYFHVHTRAVQVQAYHPGPHEVGIVWARRRQTARAAGDGSPLAGSIVSITRKEFPVVTGDGRRTLRELILAHPRFRLQAGVFLERLRDRLHEVPGEGEPVRLAESGNHCQGTLFRDGSDLITPALERRIEELARRAGWEEREREGWGGWGERGGWGGGEAMEGDDTHQLDYGRFDIRYRDEDDLRAGRIDGVVELNGVTGEPTALYDPSRSPLWAYRLLFGQWRSLYELGAARRDAGSRPMTVPQILRALREHYRDRPGSALAD